MRKTHNDVILPLRSSQNSFFHLEHFYTPSLTFTGLSMGDGLGHVPVVTLLAVMAVTAGCVMPAVQADPSAPAT